MAEYNLDKYNADQGFAMGLNIRRENPNPLDNSYLWSSLAEAENYAKNNPTAYVGQILAVVSDKGVSESNTKLYQIVNKNGKLIEVGTNANANIVVDTQFNTSSSNPIANKTVANKINNHESRISSTATKVTELEEASETLDTKLTDLLWQLTIDTVPSYGGIVIGRAGTGEGAEVFNLATNGTHYNLAGGNFAHAEGQDCQANGDFSHAEGNYTVAGGEASHVEGASNSANGNYSHAEGQGTSAEGQCSHAEGYGGVYAKGTYSHAEGYGTQALEAAAHAEGDGTEATGPAAHSEGYYTTAEAHSHAEGERTYATNTSHAEGYTSGAVGDYSHAEGNQTITCGDASHAEGCMTAATGDYSHAEGYQIASVGAASHAEGKGEVLTLELEKIEGATYKITSVETGSEKLGPALSNTYARTIIYTDSYYSQNRGYKTISSYSFDSSSKCYLITLDSALPEDSSTTVYYCISGIAIGDYSHIEGLNCQAEGACSHAEGSYNHAKGDNSHVEGYATYAEGECSHAEGYGGVQASGIASHAEGYGTYATGDYSHSEGNSTEATGASSHAEGYESSAEGAYAHAEGYGCAATGPDGAHAEGYWTTASGDASHAEGYCTEASGSYSHAEGYGTSTNSYCAHAEGYETEATSEYSHAEGYKTTAAYSHSHAEGNDTYAGGDGSHAEGKETYTSGNYAHAEGYQTWVYSNYGHTEGYNTYVNSDITAGHAEGYSTSVNGSYGHAEGRNTYAIGEASHAEGQETVAIGQNSHTEGYYTEARGQNSHAGGNSTVALGENAYAMGDGVRALGSNSYATGCDTLVIASNAHGEGCHEWGGDEVHYLSAQIDSSNTKILHYSDLSDQGKQALLNSCYLLIYPDNNDSSPYYQHVIRTSIVQLNEDEQTIQVGSFLSTLLNLYGDKVIVEYAIHNYGVVSGDGAHIEGAYTHASSMGAHAEGYYTQAKGFSSHAEGGYSIAFGYQSHAEGNANLAIGDSSHAEGCHYDGGLRISLATQVDKNTETYIYDGNDYFTPGKDDIIYCPVFNRYAQVTGVSNSDDGYTQITVNASLNPDRPLEAGCIFYFYDSGYSIGAGSHIEGYNTSANGEGAHAEGGYTKALGDYTHTEGYLTQAKDAHSHAEGYKTVAAISSHAEGYESQALGDTCHAENSFNIASASARNAHVEGCSNIAHGDCQHVQGKYNLADTNGTYAHIVGNGTDENNRSNAHVINWDGDAWFAGDVYVSSGNSINGWDNSAKKLAKEEDVFLLPDVVYNGYASIVVPGWDGESSHTLSVLTGDELIINPPERDYAALVRAQNLYTLYDELKSTSTFNTFEDIETVINGIIGDGSFDSLQELETATGNMDAYLQEQIDGLNRSITQLDGYMTNSCIPKYPGQNYALTLCGYDDQGQFKDYWLACDATAFESYGNDDTEGLKYVPTVKAVKEYMDEYHEIEAVSGVLIKDTVNENNIYKLTIENGEIKIVLQD